MSQWAYKSPFASNSLQIKLNISQAHDRTSIDVVPDDKFFMIYHPDELNLHISQSFEYIKESALDLAITNIEAIVSIYESLIRVNCSRYCLSILFDDTLRFNLPDLLHMVIESQDAEDLVPYSFHILLLLFYTDVQHSVFDSFLTDAFCDRAFTLVITPEEAISQERREALPMLNILSLFNSERGMSSNLKWKIRKEAAMCLRNIFATRPSLALPFFREDAQSALCQIVRGPDISEDNIGDILSLCCAIVRFADSPLQPGLDFTDIFLEKILVNGRILLDSLSGIYFSIINNHANSDLIIESQWIDSIIGALHESNVTAVELSVEICRLMMKWSQRENQGDLAAEIDWGWIRSAKCFQGEDGSELRTYCFTAIKSMMKHYPPLASQLLENGTIDVFLDYARNGSYMERRMACNTLIYIPKMLRTSEESRTMVEKGLIEVLYPFGDDADAKFACDLVGCMTFLLQCSSDEIYLDKISKSIERTDLLDSLERMQDSDSAELSEKAIEFDDALKQAISDSGR